MVDIEVREISMNDDLEYDLELDDYCIDELIMELEDYYSINLDSFYDMKSQIFTVRDFVNFVKEYV